MIPAVRGMRVIVALAILVAVLVAGCSGPSKASPRRARPKAGGAGAAASGGPPGARSAPAPTPSATPSAPTPSAPTPSAAAPSASTGTPGASTVGALPPVLQHGMRAGNKVALTFDADMTDAMLATLRSGAAVSYANLAVIDQLERRGIPATFFITGEWAEQYPDVVRRLAANPRFELANHSYRHGAFTGNCYNLPRVPVNEMTADVARTFTVLEPFGGRQTRYFRFPGLCHDPAALQALCGLGVTVVDGDVVSGDPFATAAGPIVHNVLSTVRAGSIVIMHVTEANAQFTDEALGPILDGLTAAGLRPVPLSDLDGAPAAR